MNPDRINAIFRHLETENDAQLAARSLPLEGVSIRVSEQIDTRYIGTTRLPPGPPAGLFKRADGSYGLKNVAIVRVQPETALLAAQKMVRRSTITSLAIGAGAGAVTLVLLTGIAHFRYQRDALVSQAVTAPCLVVALARDAVSCRVGQKIHKISAGKYFPDGRFQLAAINDALNGFTATHTIDRQTIAFQLDLIPSTIGAPTK